MELSQYRNNKTNPRQRRHFVAAVKRQAKSLVLFLPGDIYRVGYIVSCPQRLVIDLSFDNSTVNEFGIKRNENKRQKLNELKSIKDRQLVRNECKLPVTDLNLPPMSYSTYDTRLCHHTPLTT